MASKKADKHIPLNLCPVHVLWPIIERRAAPGEPIFPAGIAEAARSWLRIALQARGAPDYERYTLHSLRRGGAQEIISSGGDLSTLLKAGGWRSSAFRAYLDLVGLENSVVSQSISSLFDLDEDAE